MVSAAEVARGSFLMEWAVSDMVSAMEAKLFVRKTVEELLFEGYEDSIMEIGSTFTEEEEYGEEYGEADYGFEEYGFEEYGAEEYGDEKEEDEKKVVLDKFGFFYKVWILSFPQS